MFSRAGLKIPKQENLAMHQFAATNGHQGYAGSLRSPARNAIPAHSYPLMMKLSVITLKEMTHTTVQAEILLSVSILC